MWCAELSLLSDEFDLGAIAGKSSTVEMLLSSSLQVLSRELLFMSLANPRTSHNASYRVRDIWDCPRRGGGDGNAGGWGEETVPVQAELIKVKNKQISRQDLDG